MHQETWNVLSRVENWLPEDKRYDGLEYGDGDENGETWKEMNYVWLLINSLLIPLKK